MASGQTANYQLNQWEAEDKVLRTEFNADNAKLDAALAAHDGALAAHAAALEGQARERRPIQLGTAGSGLGGPCQAGDRRLHWGRPGQPEDFTGRHTKGRPGIPLQRGDQQLSQQPLRRAGSARPPRRHGLGGHWGDAGIH